MTETPPSSRAERLLRIQTFLLILLGLGLGVNVWVLGRSSDSISPQTGPLNNPDAQPRPTQAGFGTSTDEERTIAAYKRARRSVVGITVGTTSSFQRKGQKVPVHMPRGTGSGIVWDAEGWIVTNWHVVSEGAQIFVTLAGQEYREAIIVGASVEHDLAVIKINPSGLDLLPIPIGTSHDLEVGQSVLALGSPFYLDGSLSKGIISGLQRSFRTDPHQEIEGAIQTDAAINPGSSGGALLDLSGRLIGINTAMHSASSGVGFAIPVDTINELVPRIIAGEMPMNAGRAILGILMLNRYLMPNDGKGGVIIDAVIPGGGAEQAGLQSWVDLPEGGFTYDRIIAIDGETIEDHESLLQALKQHRAGEKVEVTLQRTGEDEFKVMVTLGATR